MDEGFATFPACDQYRQEMPAISESQMDEAATLLAPFVRKDEREFRRDLLLQ